MYKNEIQLYSNSYSKRKTTFLLRYLFVIFIMLLYISLLCCLFDSRMFNPTFSLFIQLGFFNENCYLLYGTKVTLIKAHVDCCSIYAEIDSTTFSKYGHVFFFFLINMHKIKLCWKEIIAQFGKKWLQITPGANISVYFVKHN